VASSDALIILKTRSIEAVYVFSLFPSGSYLRSVTQEYGCVAPLSVTPWGRYLLFLSRRGLDMVMQTVLDVMQPVEKPVSWDMKKYTDRIDWNNAAVAACNNWNNRIFLALPLKGAAAPTAQNNTVLSLNLLNSQPNEGQFGWEGVWTGAALLPFNWARLTIFGEARMSFVSYAAQVCWLGDDWLDAGNIPIADQLVTRAYFKGEVMQTLKGEVNWDALGANVTVALRVAGINTQDTLLTKIYDKTKYQIANVPAYDPTHPTPTGFAAPHRADYSMSAGELFAGQLEQYQNTSEPLRARLLGRNPQLVISNASGSLKVVKVELAARRVAVRATTT